MNYDHLHMTYDFWANDIRPLVQHRMQIPTFDAYLKEFSLTKSGKWLRMGTDIHIVRPPMALDPIAVGKKYEKNCVTFNAPSRPEEGMGRIIYQFSPTIHGEGWVFAWVENNTLNSYLTFLFCYNNEKEFTDLLTELQPLRRTGNTEERSTGFHPGGFAGLPFMQKDVDNPLG